MTKGDTNIATRKVELKLPEELFPSFGEDSRQVEKTVLEVVVLELVRNGVISSAFGAKVLRLEYRDFLDLMAAHNVPIVDYRPEGLEEELNLLKRTSR